MQKWVRKPHTILYTYINRKHRRTKFSQMTWRGEYKREMGKKHIAIDDKPCTGGRITAVHKEKGETERGQLDAVKTHHPVRIGP